MSVPLSRHRRRPRVAKTCIDICTKGCNSLHVGSSYLARHLVPELPEHCAPNLVRDLQLIAVRSGRSGLVCEVVINYFRQIGLRSFAWEPARGVEAGAGTGARREASGELDECWICDEVNPEKLKRCSLSSAGDSSALPWHFIGRVVDSWARRWQKPGEDEHDGEREQACELERVHVRLCTSGSLASRSACDTSSIWSDD